MDVVYNPRNTTFAPSGFVIMDNDSGYVSNNLDQESNSDSVADNLDNSSLEILKSFIPKSVYISEDALLERPDLVSTDQEDHQAGCSVLNPVDLSNIANSEGNEGLPRMDSFQSDSGSSAYSLIVPVAKPIYYNLSSAVKTPPVPTEEEHINSEMSDEVTEKIITNMTNISIPVAKPIHYNLSSAVETPLVSKEEENIHSKISDEVTEKILTNMTNISIVDLMEAGPSKAPTPQRRNSVKNKENILEVFKTPSKTRKRKFSEVASPCDMFSDSESTSTKPSPSSKIVEEKFVHKFDQRLVRRVQKTLSGVPPPPDLTVTRLTVDDIVLKLEQNKSLFWTRENLEGLGNGSGDDKTLNESHNSSVGGSGSILIDGQHEEAVKKVFPDILYSRHHGLHHNRSKLSEEIEHLCTKYAQRYIGAETQSTCSAVETEQTSPDRRRALRAARPKWAVKSPGRRLSHLAKRRITFSSASLNISSSSSAASRARQILVDKKKLELLNRQKSPKKTPTKSPVVSPRDGRTPSSSAKRKLRMRFRLLSGDFKEKMFEMSANISNSKRALFQSPDKDSRFRGSLPSSASSISSFERDLASGGGVKRSLFSSPAKASCRTSLFPSPNKRSPFRNKQTFEKKRKRDEIDEDDENSANQSKFFRSQSLHSCSSEAEPRAGGPLARTRSEGVLASAHTNEMSLANRKKLLWAVYGALKDQNITPTHPQFKAFASVLARVIRRVIAASNIRLESTGTSEKMLKIARRHVYAVVKGKSLEEIMTEINKNQTKNAKPRGYVAPQDYNPGKDSALRDRDSNSGDSVTKVSSQTSVVKPESRIDRIRKVINFEDRRQFLKRPN